MAGLDELSHGDGIFGCGVVAGMSGPGAMAEDVAFRLMLEGPFGPDGRDIPAGDRKPDHLRLGDELHGVLFVVRLLRRPG